MAQNEMKAKPALPERVRPMEGLGVILVHEELRADAPTYRLLGTSRRFLRDLSSKALQGRNNKARRDRCMQGRQGPNMLARPVRRIEGRQAVLSQ